MQKQINSAIAFYSSGHIHKALDVVKSLISDYPKEAILHNISGACYASLGQTEDAILSLLEVVNYNGSKLLADDALYLLGEIYENTYGDKENAMEYYQRVFSEHAGSILASQARAKFRALRGDKLYN